MSEAAADADPIDQLGFPGPPHRIGHSRPGAVLAAGYVAMALLFGFGVAILVAYFGFNQVGSGLIIDSLADSGAARCGQMSRIA